MIKICVVEDENSIAEMVRLNLELEGYHVTHFDHGLVAKNAFQNKFEFDLIILDVMLPGVNGVDLCKEIRKTSKTPILFLSAKGTTTDRIEGLKAGANDYIKKPFSFEELLERIKIHFRVKNRQSILTLGNITINRDKFQVLLNNNDIALTQREFELLEYLIRNKGKVCTRNAIIEDVWKINFEYDTGVIDVFMNAIRKKLNLTKDQELIKTIRGVGYIAND